MQLCFRNIDTLFQFYIVFANASLSVSFWNDDNPAEDMVNP